MTITIRITLPGPGVARDTARLLRAVVPVAAPVVLAAADAGGLGLPARLLVHGAVEVAQQTVAARAA